MSIELMTRVWKDNRTSGSARIVLLALADMANEHGECWPGYGTIARRANISRRTAFYAIAWLKDHGFLLIKRRRRARTNHESNLYQVRIPEAGEAGESPAPLASHDFSGEAAVPEVMQPGHQGSAAIAPGVVQPEHQGSATAAPGVVQPEHQGSVMTAPKSLINPQINQFDDDDEGPPKGYIFQLYEQNIGVLTPVLADTLKDAEDTYPQNWVEAAVRESVRNNKRSWSYVDKVLKRWQRDGFGVDGRKKPNREHPYPDRTEERFGDRMLRWAEKQGAASEGMEESA